MTALATKRDEGAAPQRRCIATGRLRPVEELVRFVVGPDGDVVPDVAGKLPGRGLWVTAQRAALAHAVAKNDFAKAAKASVKVAPDLAERLEALLASRMLADLGLARRAGQLVFGFDNVMRALDAKSPPGALVEALDGAADGRKKLASAAASRGLHTPTIACLSRAELSLALGRENVIHAALKPGPLAARLIVNSARLAGLRGRETAGSIPAGNERHA